MSRNKNTKKNAAAIMKRGIEASKHYDGEGEYEVTVAHSKLQDEILTLVPADIHFAGSAAQTFDDSAIPAEFREGLVQEFGSLPPVFKFDTPGQTAFGYFARMEENIGPNQSRLYYLLVPKPNSTERLPICIWGSTALDMCFDDACPQTGDKLVIIYVGDAPAKAGQNPARLFRLRVIRKDPHDVGF